MWEQAWAGVGRDARGNAGEGCARTARRPRNCQTRKKRLRPVLNVNDPTLSLSWGSQNAVTNR